MILIAFALFAALILAWLVSPAAVTEKKPTAAAMPLASPAD